MSGPLILVAPDEEAMVALGERFGGVVEPGMVVFLEGELGMGKTPLTRGVLRAMGHQGAVKSPTYTLVEPYEFADGTMVYHFDLYRLGDPEELEFMGIRDYFGEMSLCLVEWPERGRGALPVADLVITIEPEKKGRRLGVSAATGKGSRALAHLAQ